MHAARCPADPEADLTPAFDADDRFWGLDGRFTYARCGACGSWVLTPRPDPSEMGAFYAGYYTETMLEAQRRPYRRHPPERAGGLDRLRALDFVRRARRLGVALGPKTRMLDVGCGLGGFARFVRDSAGVEIRGVDFDPACRDFAREVHDLEVDPGELAAQAYPDGHFDVVTSWHCLEHTFDPAAELAEIARVTRPGGTLQVEIPTITTIGRLFRGRWLFLQAPTHLVHLRPRALRALVERAGFDVIKVMRPWLPSELAGSLLLAAGVKGFAPRVFAPRGTGDHLLRWALAALMVIDVPVTLLAALLGDAGVVRLIARRRTA